MPGTDSFDDCLARLRLGDESAAQEIFDRFARRLIGLAQRRLSATLRQKVDPEDVLQSAFKSFFRAVDRPYELASWDSLWSLLARITLRKCGHTLRHFRTDRRDVRRETAPGPTSSDVQADWQALTREPNPAEAAALAETVEDLLKSLSDRDRHILVLSLQGQSPEEVSVQVQCTERTVYRVLAAIRLRLQGASG